MCLLEGKSMLLEVIRHNWSHRQLSRVSGSGSGIEEFTETNFILMEKWLHQGTRNCNRRMLLYRRF